MLQTAVIHKLDPTRHALAFVAVFAMAIWAKAASLVIVEQPQNLIVGNGETAQFSVVVQSDLPVTYQRLFNGAALRSGTNSTLVCSVAGWDKGVANPAVLTFHLLTL